ncbi:hypothetical protein H5410_006012 [Solanum commersonii]|uniref:DUF7745 domain-containing protein n=1 Tax=Solanum commersonii TaxID=4109 RepID=A0A9J6A942_SOLCO|nr:hypothetical protein H5410_006012 [Solanum commersonii]
MSSYRPFFEAKGQVLQLTESLIDVYGGYLHRSDESLGQHVRALAPHLPKALRTEIFKHLGFLTNIMRFSPDRDLIKALIPFWDSTSNVFCFNDFELTPTLKELGGFTGLGKDLRSKTLIAPKSVSRNKFLEQMHIIHPHKECFDNGLISLEFLYSRYGKKEEFSNYEKQLKNGKHLPT